MNLFIIWYFCTTTNTLLPPMNSLQRETTQLSPDPHYTILLAEDDLDDQEFIQNAFSVVDPTFQLHAVRDGRAVLQYLEEAGNHLPCLIILDYNMPLMNGIEVLTELYEEERYRHIPKVILSTADNPKYVQDAIAKGAYAYKVKPSSFSEVLEIVREMVQLCAKAA